MNKESELKEPWKSSYPSKSELIKAWADWFESKRDDWDLFTLTVVFKEDQSAPRGYDWMAEYERVLKKIRRVLERNEANYEVAIPYEHFAYYEKDESSIKRLTGSRKPHHIHAFIPIRKSATYRFWSIDNQDIQARLRKDIESIGTIQSILVEEIPLDKSVSWATYILKAKDI